MQFSLVTLSPAIYPSCIVIHAFLACVAIFQWAWLSPLALDDTVLVIFHWNKGAGGREDGWMMETRGWRKENSEGEKKDGGRKERREAENWRERGQGLWEGWRKEGWRKEGSKTKKGIGGWMKEGVWWRRERRVEDKGRKKEDGRKLKHRERKGGEWLN